MNGKLLILSAVFLFTTVFVSGKSGEVDVSKPPLETYFEQINGYRLLQKVTMDSSALELLKLDDYLFAEYGGPEGNVTLYIGYYYTADKASAAHSPLICYPSQGWKIESRQEGQRLNVGPFIVRYKEIVTSLGKQRELVLYWFQAGHDTNEEAFKNKTNVALNKLLNKGEQHAFVRISVLIDDSGIEPAKERAVDFIREFYPQFIRFADAR